MKIISRKLFFAGYRYKFGRLQQSQVDGLESILESFENDPDLTDIRHAAYMLATVKIECADTWQPINEWGSDGYLSKYEPGTKLGLSLGNTQVGDSLRFPGRGYVMITGRANYLRLGEALGLGYDLIVNPHRALEPRVAYRIMSIGMRDGLFTGRNLSQYISGKACDYKGARRIINGQDKAEVIASFAALFEQTLKSAISIQNGGNAP